MTPTRKKHKDFETALIRLEEITELLESGDTKLEEALELYTEGVEIAVFCAGKLKDAEKKISVLKKKGEELLEVPFDNSEEIEN